MSNMFLQSFQPATVMNLKFHTTIDTALADNGTDYYFVPWKIATRDYSTWHVNDHDIINTNSFFIDLDLQNELRDLWYDLKYTVEDFEEMWDWVRQFLDQSKVFKNWRYIVFSWNWLHIHFIWESVDTTKKTHQWKFWIKYLHTLWNNETSRFFWKGIYKADNACCNLARLRRLPRTINQKNWRECRVLFENNGVFDTSHIIEKWEEEYKRIIEEERKTAQKEREDMKKNMRIDEVNIFETINSLPVELFVNYTVPQAVHDWKKNFRFAWQKNICWFFKTPHNRIANWWSHHFQPFTRNWREINSYSVFDIIHVWILGKTDFDAKSIADTILYFKENIYG